MACCGSWFESRFEVRCDIITEEGNTRSDCAVVSEKRKTNLVPGVSQVVAISVSHSDERLDGVDILLLHL